MGQTLTHGVYLPDEGERNCYAGLAGNWQLLDGAVGTIAEHTSALSGKAPLVHTHTKSDITDFPAYGTTAGTICEGNDSRLSDARTPVAHTHGKADVTDLLNSNFIPSANNSYDLGSSSYQWNNLYAKNYYYNGVAWGLDKVNTWSQNNRIQAFLEMQYLASGSYSDIRWYDENNANCCTFRQSANFLTIGKKYTSKSSWYDGAQILITASGAVIFKGYDGANTQSAAFTYDSFYPEQNNAINLGTSTNKWKTLNGINPGALSLPDLASDGYIDLSDNISANTEYSYTPTVDGWLALYCQTTGFHAENAVGIFTGGGSSNSYRWACSVTSAINLPRASKYHGVVMLPVKAGMPYLCWITVNSSTTLSTTRLYFYKATGNV